jgi:hypothetical protein
MIAFPNFNHLELTALLSEMNPQHLVLIEGVPNPSRNAWRLNAIKWINRGLDAYLTPTRYEIDPLDLESSLSLLEKIHNLYRNTHKVMVSPTGSKLQAVAVFCLKSMHPDVHIVYPVVRAFAEEYTSGWTNLLEIFIEDFRSFTSSLNAHRLKSLMAIPELSPSEPLSVKNADSI